MKQKFAEIQINPFALEFAIAATRRMIRPKVSIACSSLAFQGYPQLMRMQSRNPPVGEHKGPGAMLIPASRGKFIWTKISCGGSISVQAFENTMFCGVVSALLKRQREAMRLYVAGKHAL